MEIAQRRSDGVSMAIGGGLLLVATAAAGMMVLRHFIGVELPGCGHGSACDQAAASRWGSVLGLPTSFIGLAYFLGLFVGWQAAVGVLGPVGRWVVRAGALASVGFLVIVLVEGLACRYCIAVHVCNLLFWMVAEWKGRGVVWGGWRHGSGPLLAGAVVMVAAMVSLGGWEQQAQEAARAKAEAELAAATQQMVEAQQGPKVVAPTPAQPGTVVERTPKATEGVKTVPAATKAAGGFSGRYQWGPEAAPVRIVMFTDYQCPDCFRIEGELMDLMQNPSVSVLIKAFPLSDQCNPKSPGNLHPNACWAARAAQAAGILRGKDGFWEMHHWLFERRGSFTDKDLPPALTAMGYDAVEFQRVMMGPETLARVKADIDEGLGLGIFFTPMIFINGVELKGWNATNALTRAVGAVLAASPAAKTMAEDQPPSAFEKYMSDWREQAVKAVPDAVMQRYQGPADAPVTVVIFGDYQEPGTKEADAAVREFAATSGVPVKYVFAHFPMEQACNPVTQVTRFAGSCEAARAVEAAGVLGGPDGFWRMHAALMGVKGPVTGEAIASAARGLGLDEAELRAAMAGNVPAANIGRDVRAAGALSIQSIPMILINGKYVPRMKLEEENVLAFMMMEAWEGKR